MGLLDNLQPRFYAATCKVGTIIAGLSAEDAKTFNDALDNRDKWSSHSLAIALADKGINLARETLSSHRYQNCRCYREGK